jgi:two-component system, NarL family, response regulator DevR
MMDKIKVAMVDDDPDWIKQSITFINNQEDMLVIWAATTKEEAIQFARNSNIDIILMDINLDGTSNNYDGITAAREILDIQPVKIIMMTSISDEGIIKKSIIAGAVNYILKEDFRQIPNAIRSAYHQKSPLEVIFKDYSKLKESEQLNTLTPTEKQVFLLFQEGYSKDKICNDLCISEGTLKKHIGNILKKFDAGNIKEAIRLVKSKTVF